VTGFVEKKQRSSGRALINSGVYVLESELLASVAPGAVCDFGEDVFPHALASGLPIFAFRLGSPVIDIGTPEGLSLARSRVTMGSAVGDISAAAS
jgi:NDP-sugar pyrophosphorylase family protein